MDREDIMQIGNEALRHAHQVHDALGKKGEEIIQRNQYGDMALRADVEAEEAVLKVLQKHNLPVQVISEEHGIVTVGKDPRYLAMLDGIDGTAVYKKARGIGRYGTMFGIYHGTDPLYSDYLYGGIMEHAANKLYYAAKGQGSWLINQKQKIPIHCKQGEKLNKNSSRLYVDTAFDDYFGTRVFKHVAEKLKDYSTSYTLASCIHYVDLANGKVEAVIECTRKQNLELAVAYAIIKEAGGVMMTIHGESLENLKYSEFGQNDHYLIFSGCTSALADALRRFASSSIT